MGIRGFNLRRSQFRKMGKIGLNQPLIYIHSFPHSHPIFYLFLFNSVAKKLFLGIKNIGGAFAPLQFTPM
jgi:hypothetical protein